VQRLYVPESGRVLVDGVDLAQVDPTWLRRQIGVVLQENVLFNRSVRDNIALANPAMPTERVIAAAKLAGAHDFVLELPQGYDTIVGERGTSLSGGQRQRIAIARALITDPRILIFDEATSALDYESESIVQENMAQIARGRTVFVIAHRLSALRIANRIITIERGRLIEDGTHDDLIKTGGRYATLYRLQDQARRRRVQRSKKKAMPERAQGLQAASGGNLLRAAEADRAFLAGVRDLKAKNIRVKKRRGQANFAPRAIVEMTSVATEFTETELTAAMRRLIKTGAIRNVEEGPPTRRRSFLETAELPGLDGASSSNVVNLRAAE
jgi:ABC-type methionine transport system ATPase subunit